jgi:RHS repeat-associated protein
MSATVSAITTVAGTTRRITFQVTGPNVASPTLYNISVSGSNSAGQAFANANNASLTINPPASIQLTPSSGSPGANLPVTITGQYTNFVSGATTASFGPGISNSPVTVTSPTAASVVLTMAAGMAGGLRVVTVATGAQQATATFTVNAPIITQISPNAGTQGQQNLSVTITGQFTHFLQGTTTANFGAGITAASVTVASPTSATVIISIDPAAAIGPRTVSLTTSAEVASLASGFTVGLPPPMVLSVNPNTGKQGQQNLPVTISGSFTHFSSATQVTFSNPLLVAGPPSSITATSITVPMSIAPTAPVGPTNLTITSGAEVVTLPNGFTVTPGTPAITNANPNTGQQGQQNVLVSITGQFTQWAQGTTQVSFGSGITVNSITVASVTSLTANVNISTNANPGSYTVTATTGSEVASLSNGFTVTTSPNVSSVAPNSGQQGATNIPVTITGNLTHFSASSVVTFGNTAVTASAPTGTPTATSVTVNVNITAAAALGATSVTVTTGTEIVTLANSFTVTNGTPVITQVNPNSGQQGAASVPVTITGNFTHFSGASVVTFGNTAVTASGPTGTVTAKSLTVNVSITATAARGATNVTVTTGTEVVTLINGFTVQPAGNQPPVVSGLTNQTASLPNFTLTTYPTPTAGGPVGMTVGSDGNLWFLEHNAGQVGRITPAGAITEFPMPPGSGSPTYIVGGPDGNLWFTAGQNIWRITLGGVMTPFASAGTPYGITGGPDGNVWFTERFGNNIGRITPAGVITEFPIPTANSQVKQIALGPDGNLWFTESGWANSTYYGIEKIGRITPAGIISEFTVPTARSQPEGISGGPDGNVWFTESLGNKIGRITPTGVITEFPVPVGNCGLSQGACLEDITAGGDGNLWFIRPVTQEVGRITISGLVTDFSLPTGIEPFGIATGPDCNLWFPDITGNEIVKVNAWAIASLSGTVTDDGLPLGATLTATWNGTGPGPMGFCGVPTMTFPDVAGQTHGLAILAGFGAAGSYAVSLTGNDSQLSGSASATVTVSINTSPTISSVHPGAGQQGQTNLNVSITGQNTHFAQGTTQVTFGFDIIVNSAMVASATSLTANITIPSIANLGAHTVTVTTSSEIASLNNGFTVTAASSGPAITSVSPTSGPQAATNIPVTITGSFTHFSTSSVVTFGNIAVTASAPTGTPTATSLTVNVSITGAAALGATNVTVTTGTEVVTLTQGFTVTAGPTLTTISPNSGQQGQGGPVTIAGQNTHFVQGTSQVSFGPGITVSNVNVTCPTCLTAQLQVLATATPRPVTVTVTTGSEVASLANGFTILPGTPKILSFGPTTGQQGATVPITVTGQFTHFAQGTTQVSMGAGITVSNISVSNATSLTAQAAIDPAAVPGMRTLTVTTGTESVSVSNVFTVQPGTPALLSINPSSGQQGQSLSVVITGQFTHFVQGTTTVGFCGGVTVVGPLTVASATSVAVSIHIDPNAALGGCAVTVGTGAEVVPASNLFAITPGTPVLLSTAPNSGWQGQQNLSVAINGQFTHFVAGTTQVSFGAGITVNSVSVTSSTLVTAVVSIPCDATTGPYSVSVSTGSEAVSLPGGFPVASITGNLLVMNRTKTSILRYDTSGNNLGAFVAPGSFSGIYAELDPIGPDGNIYIVDRGAGAVKRFSGSTGAFIDDFVPPGGGGLSDPIAGAFGPDGNLYVTDNTYKVIRKYDGETKSYLGVFSSGNMVVPADITFGPDGDVYVADEVNIVRFDGATGAFISKYVQSGYGGMNGPEAVRFGCDNNLYVGTALSETAIRYDGSSGLFLNIVADWTNLHARTDGGFAFGPNGVVYVGSFHNSVPDDFVYRYKPDGTFIDDFIPSPTINVSGGGLAFQATSGPPALLNIRQNVGALGQNGLSVTINGQFTHFTNASVISLASGITVTNVVAADSTHLTANLSIAPSAVPGRRNLTVSSPGNEVVTLRNAYIVWSSPLSISPNSGLPGQTEPVTITGQGTNFAPGTSQVTFGAGITVNNVTVTGSTALTANISIAAGATLGTRTVTVTTGAEVDTLANGFTVGPPSATITSTFPVFGEQGAIISVILSGNGTHFNQGTTVVDFGTGISVDPHVQVASATGLSVRIVVDPNAAIGPRTITVTTGSEVATLTNGFTVTTGPVITVAPSFTVTLPNRLTVNYTVTDAAVQTYGGPLTVSWSAIVSPGTVGFQNQTPTSVTVGFSQAGTYVIRLSATDSQINNLSLINNFQNIIVTVTGSAVPPPTVSIATPTDGSEITTAVNVTGSVASSALSNWVLEYEPPGDASFHTLATGTTAVTNGTLGAFDPTLLINGIAYLRLTATDAYGQSTIAGPISLILTRNQKIGNFTVSFNDLSVPVAGLPIQIVRTYDSRRRFTSGADFSYGWTLDINAAKLAETVPLGNQWTETSTGGALPNYAIQQTVAHNVSVSMPDGTTYQFTPMLSPHQRSLVPIQDEQVTVTFVPAGATPPNVSLSIMGTNQPFVEGSVPGPVTLTDADLITVFDPDQYILTLPDGRTLQISMQFGLQKMTDLNGNTLTVTSAGITHSSGKSVIFTRNAANLITQITDPAGNSLYYTYNALTGDLTGVTDRASQTTTFTYDTNHGLLTILDPRGVQPIKNVYDPTTGRLIQHIDAYGKVITYANNIGTSQEVVTDRLGNVTVNNYDADGNIVQVTDALSGVTTRTYDKNDNLKTETNALGKTTSYTYDSNNNRTSETNPLNKTTSYTYNARNQVLTISDPLNHVTINTYDPATGNLLSTMDPSGFTTSYSYNSSGLRNSMTDPLGKVTQYQYDVSGNLTQQKDPLGNLITYTYDNNGNKTSETRTRTGPSGIETLLTSYQYDKNNNLIKTTYPDNSTTQIQYNAIGKQSITTDQLGHQTSYSYDLMGRLTQTTYPDATTESSTYDAEGDRVTSTDRANRMTTYIYDHLKRLTQTIYPDNTSTMSTYDKIGEVIAVQDADGNQTQYGYDNAGRRTSVTDALTRVTTFAYDDAGDQISMTDANGNQTQYAYDKNNRRTQTIYPDTTTDIVAYDALGRTVSKTDQAGKTTQFQYDAMGRLTQVTDALLQNTSYTYDEVGERISQTDANHHITTFAYDKLGRRSGRTLPLGMSETLVYDAAGNLKTKTDFNGKTTTYNYDVVNRLLNKMPDVTTGEPTVNFTYTFTGQRLSMSDASGLTNYTYDKRDRLTNKATPEGTLGYSYDFAGNLLTIQSSNTGGASVTYGYDALNRLSKVTDNRLGSIVTTYSYDKVGNLSGYLYPNGVQTGFTYDTLNRLKNIQIAKGASTLASYAYTLGLAGNRAGVTELGGRSVSYTYDSLYRLTGETISGGAVNGSIGYVYDFVGNRQSRSSTVAPILAASYSYDQNDRLITDTYDANGNTTASGGNTYAYDFENHLKNENSGAVTIVYDGDGNRVSKTVGGITTKYLVDDRNPTGYAQVLEEISSASVQRVYTYGLNRISQSQASGTSFYGYDGHGNVRLLTDSTGAVTDRYDYDAFGNIITQTGSTPNVFFYSGEQNDPNLGFYYLRARYYKQDAGRFTAPDPMSGNVDEPKSLHRYLYTASDPVNKRDPSGKQFTLTDISVSLAINATLQTVQLAYYKNLLKFSITAIGCVYCLINPGYTLENQALASLTDDEFGQSAAAAYQEGEQLVLEGYQELAKAALKVYTGTAFSPLTKITATIQTTRAALYTELLTYSAILADPNFTLYQQGLIQASAVLVAQEDVVVKVGDAKKLYDLTKSIQNVINAYENGVQGQECLSGFKLGGTIIGLFLP